MTKTAGFTLLEILIALAILSIALTAIIRALQINTRNLAHAREKVAAALVADNILAELRAEKLKLPSLGEKLTGQELMLNRSWDWQVGQVPSELAGIKKLSVSVSLTQHPPILTWTSYRQ